MGQITKSLAPSIGLSVRTPMVAVFLWFWWNFAQKLGPEK